VDYVKYEKSVLEIFLSWNLFKVQIWWNFEQFGIFVADVRVMFVHPSV
jgi:hypothetical protein